MTRDHDLTMRIVDEVIARGQITNGGLREILREWDGKAVQSALTSAFRFGYIRATQRVVNRPERTVWVPGHRKPERPVLIASVFDLAQPRTDWPKAPTVKNIHRPLGGWDEHAE